MVEELLKGCITEEDYKNLEEMIKACADVFVNDTAPSSLDKYIDYFSIELNPLELADKIVTEMFLERR